MAGDFMPLAALLAQPKPPALALTVVVFDFHDEHGTDAREGIHHGGMSARSRRPLLSLAKVIEDFVKKREATRNRPRIRDRAVDGGECL